MIRNDRYFCTWPECGRSYCKPSKLAEHYRSHTNERCFECKFEGCGNTFLRKGHLQRHESTVHLKERPFVCEKEGCGAVFPLKHHLTRHARMHENPRPFKCNWEGCSESFAKHEKLRIHLCLKHTGEPIYRCEKCPSAQFNTKAERNRHEKTAHSSRMYACGYEGCGQTFTKWTLAVAHRKEEHKTLSTTCLMCEECGRGHFKSEASLRQHCRMHGQPAPVPVKHACPQCSAKEFSSRAALKAHLKAVHSSDLPYVCPECGKGYGYKALLKRHEERGHSLKPSPESESESEKVKVKVVTEKERCFSCNDCHRRFFRQYDLDRHINSIHRIYK